MNFVKGEIYMVRFNGEDFWAEVEYRGKDKLGNFKFESTTFGDIYKVSKDLKTIDVCGKLYEITRIY